MLDKRTKLHKRAVRTRKSWTPILIAMLLVPMVAGIVKAQSKPVTLLSPLSEPQEVPTIENTLIQSDTPVETQGLSVDTIVDGIWELESNQGRAGIGLQAYCENLGMSNEFGYGGMAGVNGEKICFDTHEIARARIVRWVNKHYKLYEHDLGRTLCRYNQGGSNSDCKYYQDYLKVSK